LCAPPEPLELFEVPPPEGRLLPAEGRELPADDRLLPADERELGRDGLLRPTDDRELPPVERVPPIERGLGAVYPPRLLPTDVGDRVVDPRTVEDPDGDVDGRL
jgi:hypothetical protein